MAQRKVATAGRPRRGETRWGVRKRSTAVAVAVVAVALLLGGVILLVLLQTSLAASTDSTARQKALDVIAEMEDMDVEDARAYITDTAHAGQFVQLLDSTGYVVVASDPEVAQRARCRPSGQPRARRWSRMSRACRASATTTTITSSTVGARTGTMDYSVVVAQAAQIQADTISTVAWFMLGATPLLLAHGGGFRVAARGPFAPSGRKDPRPGGADQFRTPGRSRRRAAHR